jgi:hypothetical protein
VTGTGTKLPAVEPFPRAPLVPAPQHLTPPPAVTAQGNAIPTDTEVTPLVGVRPVTGTGTPLLVAEPFPSVSRRPLSEDTT